MDVEGIPVAKAAVLINQSSNLKPIGEEDAKKLQGLLDVGSEFFDGQHTLADQSVQSISRTHDFSGQN